MSEEQRPELPSHQLWYKDDLALMHIMVPFMNQVENMKCMDDDVFVCSWPKCGTTWVQTIVMYVMNDANLDKFGDKTIEDIFPMLELIDITGGTDIPDISAMPSPRLMKTHVPFKYLCEDIRERRKKPKIVYVTRNPKDAIVSFYHFDPLGFSIPGVTDPEYCKWTFSQYLNCFFHDATTFGSYWDHNLEFWERKDWDNILFLKYEDMLKDPRTHVVKIADFLGKKLTEEQIDTITTETSFTKMKSNNMVNYSFYNSVKLPQASPFIRKGRAGGWKTYFTVAESEKMDKIYEEKFRGTGLQHSFNV
ncbi:PREDICTED: sulfotransferase 1C2A-like [Priapulus caudatus]|uniref:Sulfotransferase 1C2A-like n=1 Tax=Priapulus caudatus TaxID=37621 RepID=A0ABM1E0Q8_PRICU|nr:PREDICTED: sulfotransferase 1C2A-like [Priapulus caudatus]